MTKFNKQKSKTSYETLLRKANALGFNAEIRPNRITVVFSELSTATFSRIGFARFLEEQEKMLEEEQDLSILLIKFQNKK